MSEDLISICQVAGKTSQSEWHRNVSVESDRRRNKKQEVKQNSSLTGCLIYTRKQLKQKALVIFKKMNHSCSVFLTQMEMGLEIPSDVAYINPKAKL